MWTYVWLETVEEGTYHWNIWRTYTTLCLFQNVWHISLISLTLAHYMNDWVQSLNANSTPLLYIYKLEKLRVEILWCFLTWIFYGVNMKIKGWRHGLSLVDVVAVVHPSTGVRFLMEQIFKIVTPSPASIISLVSWKQKNTCFFKGTKEHT
jgi:hypothetical protein